MPPASAPIDAADEDAHDDRRDAGHEADLGAVQDAAVLVATLGVRAHDVLARGRLEPVGEAALERAVRREERREERGDDEHGDEDHAEQRRLVAEQAAQRVAPQAAAGAGARRAA